MRAPAATLKAEKFGSENKDRKDGKGTQEHSSCKGEAKKGRNFITEAEPKPRSVKKPPFLQRKRNHHPGRLNDWMSQKPPKSKKEKKKMDVKNRTIGPRRPMKNLREKNF